MSRTVLPRADQLANFIPRSAARFYIESHRGLVQKEQVRIAADGQRKQHALPLPAREIAEFAVAQFSSPAAARTPPSAIGFS